MSASHKVKPPLAAALAAVACLLGLPAGGQVFGPEGAEYQIVGPMAGDQMHAALALRDGYGFVVWQDSRSDGEGSGIGARQLGGTFNSGASPSFRVNSSRGGDQEKPKVAVLSDKSTLFVWQSGTEGAQKIVGRILLANGAFAGQEFDISDPAAGSSIDADIAALPGGKAVVTWSTFGPDGDLQGVFGQVIGSGGISPEGFVFQANQFFRFNQRNPSVSALSDGRFVIAWISEQQRIVGSEAGTKPSVDVYARIFDSGGEPASSEFRLNDSNQICANPSIAGLQGGGFLASWNERSLIRSNSWDVRVSWHSSSGAAVGSKQLANSFLPGDQILPSVAVLGDRQLVAWTSTFQDGNREGVYAQLFRNGAKVGDEFRVNDWILGRQIHPVVASDNQNRLAVVWSSFVGTQGFDLHAKRYSLAGTLPSPDSPMAVPFGFGGIQVSWAPVGGYPSASFELSADGKAAQAVPGYIFLDQGLLPDSQHSYRVRFVLPSGDVSPWSTETLAKTWGVDDNLDGIPDDWQARYWGPDSESWPSPLLDSDGDGMRNRDEFIAGTDPRDNRSLLILDVQPIGRSVRLSWNAVPGAAYQLQVNSVRDPRQAPQWTNAGDLLIARNHRLSTVLQQQEKSSMYRVRRIR